METLFFVGPGQDRVCNRDNESFVKTNAWKSLFRKWKKLHWHLMPFCFKWWFCVLRYARRREETKDSAQISATRNISANLSYSFEGHLTEQKSSSSDCYLKSSQILCYPRFNQQSKNSFHNPNVLIIKAE